MDAVAEDDRRVIVVVGLRDVLAVRWRKPGEIIGLVPFDLVDANRERALRAFGSRRGQKCQRLLVQREALESLTGVTVSQNLAGRLTVGRLGYVAVHGDPGAVVLVRQRRGELNRGVNGLRSTGQPADAPREYFSDPA